LSKLRAGQAQPNTRTDGGRFYFGNVVLAIIWGFMSILKNEAICGCSEMTNLPYPFHNVLLRRGNECSGVWHSRFCSGLHVFVYRARVANIGAGRWSRLLAPIVTSLKRFVVRRIDAKMHQYGRLDGAVAKGLQGAIGFHRTRKCWSGP
jgi:hypothetical protein